MCRPDETTERRLQQAIGEMTPIAERVLLDPALAIDGDRLQHAQQRLYRLTSTTQQ